MMINILMNTNDWNDHILKKITLTFAADKPTFSISINKVIFFESDNVYLSSKATTPEFRCKQQFYLEAFRLCRGLFVPHHSHDFPDLDHSKSHGDPGGAGQHPGRLVHVLLLLLKLGLLHQVMVSMAAQRGAPDRTLTLHLDGGDGNRAGRDWDVLSQDFIF